MTHTLPKKGMAITDWEDIEDLVIGSLRAGHGCQGLRRVHLYACWYQSKGHAELHMGKTWKILQIGLTLTTLILSTFPMWLDLLLISAEGLQQLSCPQDLCQRLTHQPKSLEELTSAALLSGLAKQQLISNAKENPLGQYWLFLVS